MEYNWSLFNNSNGSSHAWDFCSRPNSPYPALPYPPPPSSSGAFHALMLPDQDKSGTSSSLHNLIPADPHLTFLKLGKRHYFEDATPPVAKKGKCEGEGIPRCQVEGCEAALLKAKEYHRRHKVCEMHAKAPTVLLHGTHQRFCQQCSRFHGVAEFDEAKRSCRRRLAGHNERRRKSCQEHNSLARKHHSQQEMKMVVGVRRDEVGNKSEEYCALSLLSWNHHSHAHLPAAALRELIALNRASLSASDCTPPHWRTSHLGPLAGPGPRSGPDPGPGPIRPFLSASP